VTVDTNMDMKGPGMNNSVETLSHVAVQRPNRVAIRQENSMHGVTVVCDGHKVYTYVPILQQYSVEDAPKDMSEPGDGLGGLAILASGPGNPIGAFLKKQPSEDMLVGVTSAKYVGKEQIDGADAHHLSFEQEHFDWEMWVTPGERTLVRRIRTDMSKVMKQGGDDVPPAMKDMKVVVTNTFRDWQLDPDLPAETFRFDPPKGAKKTDSLFGGGGKEESHALVGRAAPPLKLNLLSGGTMDLSAHKDKDIVVLDFWATGCGPCVKSLPQIIRTVDEFQGKGVVFFAVNQGENADTIKKFLANKKIDCQVALDATGEARKAYHVSGIPQTVVIDRKGIVQVVHVGAVPGADRQLKREIEDIMAGKSLAAEARKPREREPESDAPVESPRGLELIWSTKGTWNAVASDPVGGRTFLGNSAGRVAEIDDKGQVKREFTVKEKVGVLRVANLSGDDGPELIAFGRWGPSVSAYDSEGTLLWVYPGGQGVDDAWPVDLNGDGFCEVVIGYNGSGGLHVLDNTGRLLWKYGKIGNVWHVCAADVDGDGAVEILTTSAAGKVHVFDRDGKKMKDLDAGCYASMVRLAPARGQSRSAEILVGGCTESNELHLVSLDLQGKRRWSVVVGKGELAHMDSLAIPRVGRWAAVGIRGGRVKVIDLDSGAIQAEVGKQGSTPEVSWLEVEGRGAPRLLAATGRDVTAFRVEPNPSTRP